MSEIILVRPDDPRLACGSLHHESKVTYEQTTIGRAAPLFLVIGRQASEETIRRGCDRFGLDAESVIRNLGGLPA